MINPLDLANVLSQFRDQGDQGIGMPGDSQTPMGFAPPQSAQNYGPPMGQAGPLSDPQFGTPPPTAQSMKFGGKGHPLDLPIAILAGLAAVSGRQGRQLALGLGQGLVGSRNQQTQESNQNAMQQWQFGQQARDAQARKADTLQAHQWDLDKIEATYGPKAAQKTVDDLMKVVQAKKGGTADAMKLLASRFYGTNGASGYNFTPDMIANAETADKQYGDSITAATGAKNKQAGMYEQHGQLYSNQSEYVNKVKIPHGLILNHILTMQAPALGAKPGIDNAMKQKQMDNLTDQIKNRDILVPAQVAQKEAAASLNNALANVVAPKARAYIAALQNSSEASFAKLNQGQENEVNKALHDQLVVAGNAVNNTRKLIENYRNHASLIQDDSSPLKKQDLDTANSLEQNELQAYKQTYQDLQTQAAANRSKMGMDAQGNRPKPVLPNEIPLPGGKIGNTGHGTRPVTLSGLQLPPGVRRK